MKRTIGLLTSLKILFLIGVSGYISTYEFSMENPFVGLLIGCMVALMTNKIIIVGSDSIRIYSLYNIVTSTTQISLAELDKVFIDNKPRRNIFQGLTFYGKTGNKIQQTTSFFFNAEMGKFIQLLEDKGVKTETSFFNYGKDY